MIYMSLAEVHLKLSVILMAWVPKIFSHYEWKDKFCITPMHIWKFWVDHKLVVNILIESYLSFVAFAWNKWKVQKNCTSLGIILFKALFKFLGMIDLTARLWGWMEFDLYFPSAIFVVLIVINLFGAVVAHLNNTNRIKAGSQSCHYINHEV